MTSAQIDALVALQRRLSHTCAIARLIAQVEAPDAPHDVQYAMRGIAATLDEIADRLDEITPLEAAS